MALNPGKPPIEASDVGEPYDGQPSKHKPEPKEHRVGGSVSSEQGDCLFLEKFSQEGRLWLRHWSSPDKEFQLLKAREDFFIHLKGASIVRRSEPGLTEPQVAKDSTVNLRQ
ncbi:Hypothetical predicted protein [Olea europaea subsp. europaea]|uniref:Uncharacterized protein n=1 Tax=Olea europaea subsp. europaea TaxID=158383 RepID=A0A8S0VIB2_OLEEU|nr:Hypothetical predicted protein [Olea europaea subsp. europaea]